MSLLRIDIKPGESIRIGDVAVITMEKKLGNIARITIEADKSVPVSRVNRQSTAQLAASMGITGKS